MMTASSMMNSRTHARCLGAVLAGAFALVLGEASAAPAPDASASATVRYDDLNLATEQGTLALYRRIVAAARAVCPSEDTRDLMAVELSRRCQARAIDSAVRDVHSSRLAALRSSETG